MREIKFRAWGELDFMQGMSRHPRLTLHNLSSYKMEPRGEALRGRNAPI